MIKRSGFVSNSSSSSFIVIGNEEHIIPEMDDYYIIGERGKYNFGWEFEKSTDFHSRVNWCFIQGMLNWKYGENSTTGTSVWLEQLYEVLSEYLRVPIYSKLCMWNNPFDTSNEKYGANCYSPFLLKNYKEYLSEQCYLDEDEFFDRYKEFMVYGEIDHQSSVEENDNIEMFESKETLIDFLFCKDSYIETGNDNNDSYNVFGT